MKMRSWICSMVLAASSLVLGKAAAEDTAPPAPPPPNAGGANAQVGQRRQFDPAQFRQRMLDRIKENLALSDDEMKALQPKIEAVQNLQQQARGGGFGGFGRRRNQDPAAAAQPAPEPKNDVEKKTQELQALLDNKDSDSKAIQDKLKELRDLREKAKGDLKKAQDELRELLTPRQEAQLVLMGLLE